MQIKIDDLMKIQDELDSRIFEIHKTSRPATKRDRILALLVELGELANETRCFKYWSVKDASSNDVVFEEFSDVLHFSLSLGVDLAYEEEFINYEIKDISLNDMFHQLYESVIAFSLNGTIDAYEKMMSNVFLLAHLIGMNEKDIRDMYFMKNEKNHQRQDTNY